MDKVTAKKPARRVISIVLVISLLIMGAVGYSGYSTYAAQKHKTLTLNAAKKLAIANSSAIEKLEIQLDSKMASLVSSVKAISVKKKNMSVVRWSPVLNFKLPTKPDQTEAHEFQYKPVKIQYEIDKINHKIIDQRLSECETVNSYYLDIVVLQYKIKFNRERIERLNDTISKNKVKLAVGDAKQSDIDTMEKQLKTITEALANDERTLEQTKKKLSNVIGLDITTNYDFNDPFLEADLDRSLLESLIQYTLDRDDGFYEICVDETSARVSMETNYKLMKQQYENKYINLIRSYVDTVINGGKVRPKPFKAQYKILVDTVNEKWNGKKRILFIKIPKNWFQGDIDGNRFIEDNPYALYEDTMAYQEARIARQQAEDELKAKVEDQFNNYVSVKNSYLSLKEQVAQAEIELEKAKILNAAGELTYEEYKAESDNYEELQNSYFDTIKLYSETLYSLDRLTCGGVSYYLGELDADLNSAGGGESYVIPEYVDGAYYYIRPIVQENQFQLGVHIPDDFEISISDYELWIDDVQVGAKTKVDKVIRHHAFDLDGTERVFIRFYNGDEFVDDVDIDPHEYSGELKIVKSYTVKKNLESIGMYDLVQNELTGMYTVKFTMNPEETVASYKIKDYKGTYLINDKNRSIEESFRYLPLLNGSLETLDIEFYDEAGQFMYSAYFDTTLLKLFKKEGAT